MAFVMHFGCIFNSAADRLDCIMFVKLQFFVRQFCGWHNDISLKYHYTVTGNSCGHLQNPEYIHVPFSLSLSLLSFTLSDSSKWLLVPDNFLSYKRMIVLPISQLFVMNWKGLGKFHDKVALNICVIDDRNIITMLT